MEESCLELEEEEEDDMVIFDDVEKKNDEDHEDKENEDKESDRAIGRKFKKPLDQLSCKKNRYLLEIADRA